MPIKIDKIYDGNSDNYIDGDKLIKYNPDDNTIRDMMDEILIYLDNVQNIDFRQIDSALKTYSQTIDDISRQYRKLEIIFKKYDDDYFNDYQIQITKINEKIEKVILDTEKKFKTLEKEIQASNKKYEDFEKETQDKLDKFDDDLKGFEDELNGVSKGLKDFQTNLLKLNHTVSTYARKPVSKITISKSISVRGKNTGRGDVFVPTDIFNHDFEFSGILHDAVRNYISLRLENPYTKYVYTVTDAYGDPKDSHWLRKSFKISKSVGQKLIEKNSKDGKSKIEIQIVSRKGDSCIGKDWFFGTSATNLNEFTNSYSLRVKLNLGDNFQASAVCDMKGTYPYASSGKILTSNWGDPHVGYYTVLDGHSSNNSYLWFEVPGIKQDFYNFGMLTYDLENSERYTVWVRNEKGEKKYIFNNETATTKSGSYDKHEKIIDLRDFKFEKLYLEFGKESGIGHYNVKDFFFKRITNQDTKNYLSGSSNTSFINIPNEISRCLCDSNKDSLGKHNLYLTGKSSFTSNRNEKCAVITKDRSLYYKASELNLKNELTMIQKWELNKDDNTEKIIFHSGNQLFELSVLDKKLQIAYGNNWKWYSTGKSISPNRVYETAVTYNKSNGQIRVFLDKELCYSGTSRSSHDWGYSSDGKIGIGERFDYTASHGRLPLNGYVYFTRVFDRCLSDEEIRGERKVFDINKEVSGVNLFAYLDRCHSSIECKNIDFSKRFAETKQSENIDSYLVVKDNLSVRNNTVINFNVYMDKWSSEINTIFSGSLSNYDNFLLFHTRKDGETYLYWNRKNYKFNHKFNLNQEYNISFEAHSDKLHLYIDGKLICTMDGKYDGTIGVVLGQEQDSYKGSFAKSQCLMGHYSHFCHINKKITDDERHRLVKLKRFIGVSANEQFSMSPKFGGFEIYKNPPLDAIDHEYNLGYVNATGWLYFETNMENDTYAHGRIIINGQVVFMPRSGGKIEGDPVRYRSAVSSGSGKNNGANGHAEIFVRRGDQITIHCHRGWVKVKGTILDSNGKSTKIGFASKYENILNLKTNNKSKFYLVKNGKSIQNSKDQIDDKAIQNGYELFCPHSKAEYEEARKYLVSLGEAKSMGPLGVYATKAIHSQHHPLNSEHMGKDGWKVKDGSSTWWASDRTNVNEPNGDYSPYAYLNMEYDNNGYIKWYNDANNRYSYKTYLCVDRSVQGKIDFDKSEVPVITPNKDFELYDLDSGIPIGQVIKDGSNYMRIPHIRSKSGIVFAKESEYIYNISGTVIATASWDNELLNIQSGNRKIFSESDIHIDGSDKYLKNGSKTLSFKSITSKYSDWGSHKSVIKGNKDLEISFNYNSTFNNIIIQSGLNTESYDEFLGIKDLKVRKLPLKIIHHDNYNNKWSKWAGISDGDIVATDNYKGVVTFGERKFKKTYSLNEGQNYIFRIDVSKINSIDAVDKVIIKINGNTEFNGTLGDATQYQNKDKVTATTKLSDISTKNLNIAKDTTRLNTLKQNKTYISEIECPFISSGSDSIEVILHSDQSLMDEAYGFSDIYIIQDLGNVKNKIYSSSIAKINSNEARDWVKVDSKTVKIVVNTSKYKFREPNYFTSLESKKHKITYGSMNVVNATNKSFEVYVTFDDSDVLKFAKDNFTLNWIGVD